MASQPGASSSFRSPGTLTDHWLCRGVPSSLSSPPCDLGEKGEEGSSPPSRSPPSPPSLVPPTEPGLPRRAGTERLAPLPPKACPPCTAGDAPLSTSGAAWPSKEILTCHGHVRDHGDTLCATEECLTSRGPVWALQEGELVLHLGSRARALGMEQAAIFRAAAPPSFRVGFRPARCGPDLNSPLFPPHPRCPFPFTP